MSAYVSYQNTFGLSVLDMEAWLKLGDGLADDMDEDALDRAWQSAVTDEGVARLDPD